MFDFKGLVKALFVRQETAAGVVDLKSATRILSELPESDMLMAQVEIIKALQQLNRNARMSLKERLRIIPYLDEKARQLQAHLIKIYQGEITDKDAPLSQVLLTITTFWAEMGNAYQLCLKQAQQSPGKTTDANLPLFALRAMRYYFEHAKWSYMRYLELDGNTWRRINRLYGWADQHGFQDGQIQPYTDCPHGSIRREYLNILMLSLSSPENMPPDQIQLTAQWLDTWTTRIDLEETIRPHRHLFAIDFAGAKPPKRLRRDMVGVHWRYWSTDTLQQNIRQTLAALRDGTTAAELGLPKDSAQPANLELMQRLCDLWSRDTPQQRRKHERRNSNREIHLLRGLKNIVNTIASQESRDTIHCSGIVANESVCGLGIHLQEKRSEALQPCEIVGVFQKNPDRNFSLGIVRRLARQADGQITAGIETITATPLVVDLISPEKNKTFQTLFLSRNGIQPTGHYLFVPHEYLAANREYILAAQGKSYRIKLAETIEYTSDAALTGFSVLEKVNA